MGAENSGLEKKKKDNENHKKLRKALSAINNGKYSCIYCYHIPEFKDIDFENQSIVIFCPEHGRKKIAIKDYLVQMNKIVQGSCEKCGKQKYIVYDHQNKKYYCKKCFNKNYKKDETPNNNKCKDHPIDDFSAFCQTCNQYICSQFEEHKDYHENHQIFKKEEYKPEEKELDLILLFKKLLALIYESYFEDENNFFNCINIKNFSKFLKGFNLLYLFNKYFNCNIKSNDKKINLKDKEIGDFGFQLLCRLNLEELEYLILSNNNISNIDDLKYLFSPKLKRLNLGHNNIRNINIFQNINFPLEELDLSSNRIDNIKVFENMNNNGLKNLRKLKLFCNNFKLDQNNINIQNQIKEKLKDKFIGEENEEYSKILNLIDSFNASYATTFNINDKKIDLSLIKGNNYNDYDQILKQFKHPNVRSIKLGKSENINIDFKNINKNCPNCNSLIFEDKQIYLKNPNPWDIKFKKELEDLEFKAKLVDKKDSYQELFPYTFTCFTSINNKKQYLIYYENIGNKADIYLVNNFYGKKNIETLENNIIFQIRYYIDVQEQKDILLGSAKESNKSLIYYWEFTEEKLNLINKYDGGISFCMISDKIFDNNFIISSDDKGTLYIWKKEKEMREDIYLNNLEKNNNKKIYFIDSYNYMDKNNFLQSNIKNNYYIIVGDEKGFISFDFIPTKEYVDIKKKNRYQNEGENKYAIIYSDNSLLYLICSDFKSNEIKIFEFETGLIMSRINLGENYLSLGLNLWNNQYLIVCCKTNENELNYNKNEIKAIKIFDLYEEKLYMEIPNESGELFSLKFIDNNSKECILFEYLDGTINLFSI